ncbi:MAG: PIG-L family deacetylase [Caldilinea sp.]|nr:PIG-L family deacetylase [Caldilinea sp.]MDW8440441.1 PIG-L family deacetylase [Caldilineaceae bacterium]
MTKLASDYHAIYLSPHLDDVALSCGGQIAQRTRSGQRVLIVTVMAGDPMENADNAYIRSLHERWGLGRDAAAQRRAEDIAACAVLGADFLHWPLPDCIYRLHPEDGRPLYVSDEDIFGDVHPAEQPLIEQIVARLRTLPEHGRCYAPLTVGHHVDHLLVAEAAQRAFGNALYFYEDYPYAQQPGKLSATLATTPMQWTPIVVSLTEADLVVKIEAISAFRSQLSTFFTDRGDLERRVRDYAASVGGERLWRKLQR